MPTCMLVSQFRHGSGKGTAPIIIALYWTVRPRLKMALAVPGTPAIPVLNYLIINKLRKKKTIKIYHRIKK